MADWFWFRVFRHAALATLPHFKGRTPRSLAASATRQALIYVFFAALLFFFSGKERVMEELNVVGAAGLAVGAVIAVNFIWNLVRAPSRMEQERDAGWQTSVTAAVSERDEARGELNGLSANAPRLRISEPQHRYDGTWYVEVLNTGAAANVRAQYRIVEGHGFVPGHRDRYQANWENLLSPTAHLMGAEARTIGLAKLITQPMGVGGSFRYDLLYWDEVESRLTWDNSTDWFAPAEGILEPDILLQVTFVCDPKQMHGDYVRHYRLNDYRLAEEPTP